MKSFNQWICDKKDLGQHKMKKTDKVKVSRKFLTRNFSNEEYTNNIQYGIWDLIHFPRISPRKCNIYYVLYCNLQWYNQQVKKRRAPTALTLSCDVCSAPSPDHYHFGGHCCYSCRAFFRRTIERMEKIEVVCRTGKDDCTINSISKSCSACRYKKCISIGMKKELLQVCTIHIQN